MSSGNVDLAPVIWWGFALCLLFVASAAIVIRLVWSARRRRLGAIRTRSWLRAFTGSCSGEGGKPRGFGPWRVGVANPVRVGGPGGAPR